MTNDKLDEIVADLRDEAATAAASEGDYYADQFTYHGCGEAADAITWLRAELARLQNVIAGYTVGISPDDKSKPTLTDEEREAVRVAILEMGTLHSGEFAKAETLRKMLERLGGD